MKAPETTRPLPCWIDEVLIDECLRGNEKAWNALVDKYKNLVYSTPIQHQLSPSDAADIFQEVWEELGSELDNLRKPGALRRWLISVTLRKCRHRKPSARESHFDEWTDQAERAQVLRDAVALLPEACQRVVQLLLYHDPPIACADVTRLVGLSEGSAASTCGRCLQMLRDSLEEKGF